MKKIIFTFIFSILFAFTVNAQSDYDQFGNYVSVTSDNKEITGISMSNMNDNLLFFTANLGKVGLFDTKYKIDFPSYIEDEKTYWPWQFYKNTLHIDEKNLTRLYNSMKTVTDTKISGAKVFASNKWNPKGDRVKLEISYSIAQAPKGIPNDTIMIIGQLPVDDIPSLLHVYMIVDDFSKLKNVIGKYCK